MKNRELDPCCWLQIAAVFEFAGALLLVRVSTNVIAGGIADINAFLGSPEAYAYGMVCALGVGTLWLIFTSWLGLNVSSTHSIGEFDHDNSTQAPMRAAEIDHVIGSLHCLLQHTKFCMHSCIPAAPDGPEKL